MPESVIEDPISCLLVDKLLIMCKVITNASLFLCRLLNLCVARAVVQDPGKFQKKKGHSVALFVQFA